MQDDLQRALDGLGLAPGASLPTIIARYRQLAREWHPDRFQNVRQKQIAEEKLKHIINCKEILEKHHRDKRPKPPPQPPPSPPPPPPSPPPPPPSPPPPPPQPPPPPPPPSPANHSSSQPGGKADKDKPWDWADDLCDFFDLGDLKSGEPPWLETLRRMIEKIIGKHPGDSILDIWDKPVSLTKDRKRKCLIGTIAITIFLDRFILFIDPQAFKQHTTHPEPPPPPAFEHLSAKPQAPLPVTALDPAKLQHPLLQPSVPLRSYEENQELIRKLEIELHPLP